MKPIILLKYAKKTLKYLFLLTKIVLGGFLVYLILVVIGTLIPVGKIKPQKEGEITIYLTTNGIHSDLVLPLKNESKNWLSHLATPTFQKFQNHQYIALGWGDYDFYLKSKTNTNILDVFDTLFFPSKGILHLQFYRRDLIENEQVILLKISQIQYKKICQYIENQLITTQNNQLILIEEGYGENDFFFEAKGTYHLFNTCNNWTNGGLKAMQIRTGLWTPFAQSIWFWVQD